MILKHIKKGGSVVTFLLTIVVLVFVFNVRVSAASAESTEVTEATEAPATDEPTNDDENEVPEGDDAIETEPPKEEIENPIESEETENHDYDIYFEDASMETSVRRASGLGFRLALSDIKLNSNKYDITWTSSNEEIATVSQNGYVRTKAAGKTIIKAAITCDNHSVYTYKCTFIVTDPHFESATYGLQVGGRIKLNVKGTTTKKYNIKIKHNNIVKAVNDANNKVKAYKLGQTEVTAKIDGRTIRCKIFVTNPKLAATDLFIVNGSTQKLVIKNWSGKTQPIYKTSNSKVATVTSSGYIEAHKDGSCILTVEVEGKTLSCYVAVSNSIVVNTLKSAYKGLGCRYSQARRMSKNCYDCSSFTWRNYSKHGVYFGNRRYAPTAAEEARNMVKNHKAIAYKYVSSSKLKPGDVLFIRSSSRNGRYRNVGHVAIYIGNGRIIHATPPRVCISNYSRYAGRVAVISRPTK